MRPSALLFRTETGALELLDDGTDWLRADGALVAQRTGTDDLLFASNLLVPAAVAASCRADRATILVETVGPGWETLAPAESHHTLGDALAACELRMREVWYLGLPPRPSFP